MDKGLIETQITATRIACAQLTAHHLKALADSVEQACCLPATLGWEHKAAAHADTFNVLANAVNDPVTAPVLSMGVQVIYDLMVVVGRRADGMIISSRRRLLEFLQAGDIEGAALEMEKHLSVLHYMYRIATSTAAKPRSTDQHLKVLSLGV